MIRKARLVNHRTGFSWITDCAIALGMNKTQKHIKLPSFTLQSITEIRTCNNLLTTESTFQTKIKITRDPPHIFPNLKFERNKKKRLNDLI